jgi:hypothetical protein
MSEATEDAPRRRHTAKQIAAKGWDVRHFEDGRTHAQPLIETALACIRQWVALEQDDEAARARLREVAEILVRADIARQYASDDGRESGRNRKDGGKAARVRQELENYDGDEQAKTGTVARRAGVSRQYVNALRRKWKL